MGEWFVGVLVGAAIMGAALGSFACCQAWRLRYLEKDKKRLGKRSVCLSCGKQLKWYENVPIISWLVQRGKCNYCGRKIGKAEFICELLGALGLAAVAGMLERRYALGEINGGELVGVALVGVVFLTLMMIVAIYDAKWQEIPMSIMRAALGLGGLIGLAWLVKAAQQGELWYGVMNLLASCGMIGGLYYLLYKLSKERLVGGGDWLVGLAVGLCLGDWWLSLCVLCLSNLLALIIMLIGRQRKIGFGPFLVAALVIVLALSGYLGNLKVAGWV